MPVNVSVDRNRKLVITTYYGDVTDADVAHQVSQIHEQAPYGPAYRAITDFSRVTQFNISSNEIRSVANSASPLGEAQRVMVAPSDEVYGTSRMFQSLASRTRPHITVVRTLAEAYASLGMEGIV